jgi:hypothetical protein
LTNINGGEHEKEKERAGMGMARHGRDGVHHRRNRDYSLAGPYVALHEPVHSRWTAHVPLDIGDYTPLGGCKLEGL